MVWKCARKRRYFVLEPVTERRYFVLEVWHCCYFRSYFGPLRVHVFFFFFKNIKVVNGRIRRMSLKTDLKFNILKNSSFNRLNLQYFLKFMPFRHFSMFFMTFINKINLLKGMFILTLLTPFAWSPICSWNVLGHT